MRKRSLRFGYEIVRLSDDQVIAEGETGHVITDATGRVRSFPEGYAQRLLAPPIIKSQASGEIVPTQEAPD
jgi:acyl-CoA thioesterase FadM